MGLKMSMTLDSGIPVPQAYIRIGRLEDNNKFLTIYVDSYYDHQSFLDGKNSIQSRSYNFPADVTDSAKNYRKQGYEFMKTLSDFQDADDVLEEGQTA